MFRKILKIMAIVFFWCPIVGFIVFLALSAVRDVFEIGFLQGIGFLLFVVGGASLFLLNFVEED